MATDSEYALLAGAAYTTTREEINRIPWPESHGWIPYLPPTLSAKLLDLGFSVGNDAILYRFSGFEARVFSNGSETVISFAGTDLTSPGDLYADARLAFGSYTEQFERAALLYAAVRQATSQPISFTGHSLGGANSTPIGGDLSRRKAGGSKRALSPARRSRGGFMHGRPVRRRASWGSSCVEVLS